MVVKRDLVTESMNPYEKPPSQSVKSFIYNPETRAFMGRTASSWGKLNILLNKLNFIIFVIIFCCR